MSSVPPVVDYKRMERLRPPENNIIPIMPPIAPTNIFELNSS